MHIRVILKILGILITLFSLTFLPPIWIDAYYQEQTSQPFIIAIILSFLIGCLLWWPNKHCNNDLGIRDGFLIAFLFWATLGLIGAIPLFFSPHPNLTITESVFESISGITTTGATVIPYLDSLPHAILYYRQQLQFFGGLGFIILAVAILPMLGIGGMQLFRMEITGPNKDNKLTPRITQTAKALWLLYLGLTLACILSYRLCGMGNFDALCYGMSTIATGGYAPHDASMGYFSDIKIKLVAIVFMTLSAVGYGLHYAALMRRSIRGYWHDDECRTFILIILISLAVFWFTSWLYATPFHSEIPFIDIFFQVVSFSTTTGFVSTNQSSWPLFMPIMLLYMGIIGGCAGSTSGGLKVIRFNLLLKQGAREIHRLIHPHGHFTIKIGKKAVPTRVIEAVWGFLSVYIALFGLLMLLILIFEKDFLTAYTSVIATFFNIGPALGETSSHYKHLSQYSQWILSLAMIAGRLEIFTVLVLFSPSFWRK